MLRRGLPLLVLGAFILQAPAHGLWSTAGSGTATIGATTVVNASGLRAACTTETDRNSTVTLTWTPSTSVFVSGYELVRTGSTDGSVSVLQVPGRSSATYEDKAPIKNGISYTYTIRAVSATNWTVPALPAASKPTWSPRCTTT